MWMAITVTPGASFGVTGALEWFRPDAAADGSDLKDIPIPDQLKAINAQSSWASDGLATYNCGGFTQNAIVTKHWQLYPMGMRAPDNVPDVVLAAGPGITANVICYIRGYDELTDERSPLSAPSATLAAANQKITYQNLGSVDVSQNPRWTHLEGWESRDGGLPRYVWRRQIGVATVTHALTLAELGEAETSSWEKPPRCRYCVFWHGRLVMAGDDDNPTTIYLMEIGFPERWAGLTLEMKSTARVVGLYEINGRLLAFGPTVTEVVSGWTEDDLKIDIIQPHIGLVSHYALVQTDGYLWIPTQEQMFLTDGASWFPVGLDVKVKWAEDFRNNRHAFQSMWCEHHPDEHTLRFYVADGSSDNQDDNTFTYWAADYETAIPSEGGNLGQPRWSYDTQDWPPGCGALLGIPGGRRKDPFKGTTNGQLVKVSESGLVAAPFEFNVAELVTPAMQPTVGGDDLHAFRVQDLTVFMRSELREWTVQLWSGDVECYTPPFTVPGFTRPEPGFERIVPATFLDGKQPEWTHHFGDVEQVVGRAFTMRIIIEDPVGVHFAGLVALWEPGTTDRQDGLLADDPPV